MPLRSDLPQGTLDMLILQITALEPIHGYAIARRMQQISRDALKSETANWARLSVAIDLIMRAAKGEQS
jgi:DNA-binding PadR family transcriptional regulator